MVKLPKGYHDNTVCSNCGSSYTGSGWLKTYDRDGNWNRNLKNYHCTRCHCYFNPNTGKFSIFSKDLNVNEKSELNFMDSDSIRSKVRVEHKDTICSNCRNNYTNGGWLKRRDENGNWDKTYICNACYLNSACRSGELDLNSSTYKGMIGVKTVAKVLGDKDCTIMKEGSPFDICSIQSLKYGKIEVKTATYSPEYRRWVASGIKPGLFDTMFIICTDSEFKNIVRVYIISGIEVGNVKTIAIYRNPSKDGWYEEFGVDDIIQYQEAFQIVKDESQISKNYVDSSKCLLSTKEKGDICEEIVRIAINAKISTDIRYDLIHEEYKNIEVKGSNYHSRHKYWVTGDIESRKFDTLFIVCMNSNFKKVKRIYIILKEDVGNISVIAILENPSRYSKYEKFRVKDIKSYQEACEKILKDNIYK